ncbi:hypothetical protein [Seonamhaeicola sp.]|uniref:hypothetical protein n=1 Tax=Seonamhaeicola sp. TaxID=1912245 RepID=UPI00260C0D5D|nr:hypothetical protein [Seonamhaeicola sp.]
MQNDLEQRNQRNRKTEPLTTEEWLTFFFLPFFTPRPNHREDHFSESEIERFKKYGFDKKLKQAYRVKTYGYLFWIGTIGILFYIIKH